MGYTGPPQFIISDNLPSAQQAPEVPTEDLRSQQAKERLLQVKNPSMPFICSPLGLAPKSNGKRRRIHHLSYPRKHSVNDYIPAAWGALEYASFDEAMAKVSKLRPGALLVKRDLAEAFRHVLVAQEDLWLLGFQWEGLFYVDRYLTFGLRTAPFIFDLFAKGLHW